MKPRALFPHPTRCRKNQRGKCFLFHIKYSSRILALLLVLMYSIDLRFHVPVRVGTRVTNPHVKEYRTLALPEPTGINVQPRIRRSIGSSTQLCTTPKIIGAKRLEKSDLCFHQLTPGLSKPLGYPFKLKLRISIFGKSQRSSKSLISGQQKTLNFLNYHRDKRTSSKYVLSCSFCGLEHLILAPLNNYALR